MVVLAEVMAVRVLEASKLLEASIEGLLTAATAAFKLGFSLAVKNIGR